MDSARADLVLTALEATETNIAKLEHIWQAMMKRIPDGVSFGPDQEYEDLRRHYSEIANSLPVIGGAKFEDATMTLNTIAQWRFDANELHEIEGYVALQEALDKPGNDIAEYKFRVAKKRRSVVRDLVQELSGRFDVAINTLVASANDETESSEAAPPGPIATLREIVAMIDRLLGPLAPRPPRWFDLRRHLSFALWGDVSDIKKLDWPAVRPALLEGLYGRNDPVPVPVADLDQLEVIPPATPIPAALAFDALDAAQFERLLFALVSGEEGYENPQWLMHTTAADRGRDISVERVIHDGLGGTRRERVLVQCKHWLSRTVGIAELSTLRDQVRLWEPPKVSVLVIATTGRFSADAVASIERQNQEAVPPRIEMWPNSHLELLLSRRPAIVAEFGLRRQ